jgi:hypothetical protein
MSQRVKQKGWRVFEKTHCVLYDEFIVQTEEFYDFF